MAPKRIPVFRLNLGTDEAVVILRRQGTPPLLVTGPGAVRTFGRWRQTTFVDMSPLRLPLVVERLKTADGAQLEMSGVIEAQVVDPVSAATRVLDHAEATCMVGETVVRAIARDRSAADFMDRMSEFETAVCEQVQSSVSDWGVTVSAVHLAVER